MILCLSISDSCVDRDGRLPLQKQRPCTPQKEMTELN